MRDIRLPTTRRVVLRVQVLDQKSLKLNSFFPSLEFCDHAPLKSLFSVLNNRLGKRLRDPTVLGAIDMM